MKNHEKDIIHRQIIRDIINEMVKDVIDNTKKNLKTKRIKNIKDVYKSNIRLVEFSEKMINFDHEIKNFLRENMYFNKKVLNKTRQGEKVIKLLFSRINKNPLKFLKRNALKGVLKERSICDFIAGMTDRYAINLYNSLK